MHPGPLLVTGTGSAIGAAVLRRLLADGWEVRALTNDPHGRRGRRLAEAGARVVGGDLEDPASVERAVAGVWGVFSAQSPLQSGTAREIVQASTLATKAARAGVRHFVQISAAGADRHTGMAHLETKARIEERIGEIGIPATILRPTFLLDDLALPGAFGTLLWAALAGALGHHRTLQVVALDDVAAFTGIVFSGTSRFAGRTIDLAGDEVTWDTAADAHLRARGTRPFPASLPRGVLAWLDPDLAAWVHWLHAEGYAADLPSVRRLHPAIRDVERGFREARRVASLTWRRAVA